MQLINVMAASLDGRIGLNDCEDDGTRALVGLTSQADQAHLFAQIQQSDAIIVGATSIRANGCCLDPLGPLEVGPAWYIFAQKPLSFDLPFWDQSHIRRVIVSPTELPLKPGSGVETLVFGENEPASFLYRHLEQSHFQRCLLFGGGIVNSWFYREKLVSELQLSLAPVMLGISEAPFLVAPQLPHLVKFSLLASHTVENFVFLRYLVT